jgi:hypothetical protein
MTAAARGIWSMGSLQIEKRPTGMAGLCCLIVLITNSGAFLRHTKGGCHRKFQAISF